MPPNCWHSGGGAEHGRSQQRNGWQKAAPWRVLPRGLLILAASLISAVPLKLTQVRKLSVAAAAKSQHRPLPLRGSAMLR
jgi:hypothetical protein